MQRFPLLATLAALALAACGGKSKPDTTPPVGEPTPDAAPVAEGDDHEQLLAAEMSAYEAAKPVLETYCGGCHIQGGAKATEQKLEHVDLTSYPFAGHHVETITTTIRHVLGIDGAKPTMPKDKPGAVEGDELALIAAWADAYDAAEDAGAHAELADEHDHDH